MKLGPNSIAPVAQDRPSLWSVSAFALLVILCLSPLFYVVAAISGVVP